MLGIAYLKGLVLTLLVETIVALLVHHRVPLAASRVHLLQTVVLIDLMTHPLLNYLLWLNAWMQWIPFESMVAILEIAVVFAEWKMLLFALGGSSRTLFGLSLAMNLASFVGGLIAFHL
jgi:hypothetical protein